MTAWWAALRGDVRRFGTRALLLAAFFALAGGVVVSAFVGARRDATVVDRLAARVNVATAALLPNDPSFDWSDIARLPNVRTLQRFAVTSFDVVDHPEIETDFPRVGPPTGEPIEDVAVVSGRRADQTRVDEATLGMAMAGRARVGVGDELVVRVQAADVIRAMLVGEQLPPIPPTDVTVRVVGIVKGGPFSGGLQTTEAFAARYADDLVPPGAGYINALVRLDGGEAAIDELSREVDQLAGRPVEVMDVNVFVQSARTATRLESTALLAFAITAGLVVLVLGAVWVGRVQVNVGEAEPPTDLVDAWRGDDRVAAAVRIADLVVGIDDRPVALLALEELKGASVSRPLHGRLPQAVGEVAFAPGELDRLGLAVGDTAHLADGTALHVVGEAFTVALGHTNYDAGGQVTPEQMAAIEAAGTVVKFDVLAIRTAHALSADESDEVWLGRDHDSAGLVDPQHDLGRTRSLPRTLAWFAGALAAVTAAVVLVSSTRRRRRDVAVLQVLGLTRRQARQIIGWQLLASVSVAVVAGLPVGFAIGRTLWQTVVDGVPLRYATPTAWGAVGVVVLGVALLAALLAVRTVTITAADEPALSLRAE